MSTTFMQTPSSELPEANSPHHRLARRTFLFIGAATLVGCGTKKVTSSLPSPIWSAANPQELYQPDQPAQLPVPSELHGAISRSTWAKGQPIARNMNRMLPARYITIHHDGMTPFTTTSKNSAASRLETIRKSHLRRDGGRWGDIGYHFAIDPAGRLWQARPLIWQGAHVKARNEGNIGVVVLGNYERQGVNSAQAAAVESTIQSLMRKYKVPVSRVRTHQEWAATACPGKSLQRVMVGIRGTSLKNA
ncbi:N-acetylmuramoyl-L-alanine amidase [bacterium]|nr:N-acetylmuramoyl-L-alanine amidase [bacterium]